MASPHYLLRQGLSLNPDLAFSAALDSRFAPRDAWSQLSKDYDYKQAIHYTCPDFMWVIEIQTQV